MEENYVLLIMRLRVFKHPKGHSCAGSCAAVGPALSVVSWPKRLHKSVTSENNQLLK